MAQQTDEAVEQRDESLVEGLDSLDELDLVVDQSVERLYHDVVGFVHG